MKADILRRRDGSRGRGHESRLIYKIYKNTLLIHKSSERGGSVPSGGKTSSKKVLFIKTLTKMLDSPRGGVDGGGGDGRILPACPGPDPNAPRDQILHNKFGSAFIYKFFYKNLKFKTKYIYIYIYIYTYIYVYTYTLIHI